eukprot:323219-Rhodomonas_salina.1
MERPRDALRTIVVKFVHCTRVSNSVRACIVPKRKGAEVTLVRLPSASSTTSTDGILRPTGSGCTWTGGIGIALLASTRIPWVRGYACERAGYPMSQMRIRTTCYNLVQAGGLEGIPPSRGPYYSY